MRQAVEYFDRLGKFPAFSVPHERDRALFDPSLRIVAGISLAGVFGTTMRRGTALLVVMLLAGTPGVSLACELWCDTPAAETHHSTVGCHLAPNFGIAGEQVVATASGCHGAAAVTAFVNESRRPDTRPVTIVLGLSDTPAVCVRGHVTDEGWSVFNGQASRPSAFRTVLRI